MLSDRTLRALYVVRISFLFGTLGCLYAGYIYTFANHDVMASYSIITTALINGTLFIYTFPAYRIDFRFNQLQKKLSERIDIDSTLSIGKSTKNDAETTIKLMMIPIVGSIFIIFNFVLGWVTFSNGNNSRLFIHMVIIVASVFLLVSSLLVYKIDIAFRKIEKLISQLNKKQPIEAKSE